MTSTYGPIITSSDIEDAVTATLRRWLDTMLGEVERQSDERWGLREIQRPKSWQLVTDYKSNTADRHLPCIAVEAGPEELSYGADGMVNSQMGLTVVVIAKGQTRDKTRETVAGLTTGVIQTLLKHGDLDGFAVGTVIGTVDRDAVSADKAKTVAGTTIAIAVMTDNVASRWGGPEDPDDPVEPLPEESPEWPEHLSTHVTVSAIDEVVEAPTGDRAGANVSVVFSEQTAVAGESGSYRVRTETSAIRFTLGCTQAPAGAPLTVEALRNGVAIGALSIPAGSTTSQVLELAVPLDVGDLLSVNATSVGTISAAMGVTAQIDLGS